MYEYIVSKIRCVIVYVFEEIGPWFADNIFYRRLTWIHTNVVFELPIHSLHPPGT